MKILHVVTLITPEGIYGGPATVALNQAAALTELGHEVTVVAGHFGSRRVHKQHPEIRYELRTFKSSRLLPKQLGFAGTISIGLLFWLTRHVHAFDIVHVHLARDLVTMPATIIALGSHRPVFIQTHGMIDSSNRRSALVLDTLATRPIFGRATEHFYLNEHEKSEITSVSGSRTHRLTELPNGVPTPRHNERDQAPPSNEVLFLARLQARKNPLHFVQAASQLTLEFPSWKFTLVGPDEGQGTAVTDAIRSISSPQISWQGPISPPEAINRMRYARLYVLPSINEPFPMSVLEAMSVGLPIVVTSSCGLAPAIRQTRSGYVADGTSDGLASALRQLISDDEALRICGDNARRAAETNFSMEKVAMMLAQSYERGLPSA